MIDTNTGKGVFSAALRGILTFLVYFSICGYAGYADEQIRPEMNIRFSHGAIACLKLESLLEITQHSIAGETTKADAMMTNNGGDCLMISRHQILKVLSVQYNNPDLNIGLVEVVGEGVVSLDGAWAYTVGAEQVQSQPKGTRRR